jgi:hypothetical protein
VQKQVQLKLEDGWRDLVRRGKPRKKEPGLNDHVRAQATRVRSPVSLGSTPRTPRVRRARADRHGWSRSLASGGCITATSRGRPLDEGGCDCGEATDRHLPPARDTSPEAPDPTSKRAVVSALSAQP